MFALTAVSATAARGYTLVPTPQQVLREAGRITIDETKIVLSSKFKTQDPRVLRSLQAIFPKAVLSDQEYADVPGGVLIVAENSQDAIDAACQDAVCEQAKPEDLPKQGYFLHVANQKDFALVLIGFNGEMGEFYATKTLKQLYENGTLPEITIRDWPDFEARGILEGFYGKPWPADKRLALIPWMADYKFDSYMYAPKDDNKTRFSWRSSFSDGDLRRLKEIADASRENFVQFCWELSPGLSAVYSSQKDIVFAYKKFKAVIGAGIDCIVLAFDDVGYNLLPADLGKFSTYWDAQMQFTNKLFGKLLEEYPKLRVAFVPNDYWGNLVEESEYLRYVGAHLDPRAQFGWTGNQIIPTTVMPEDAKMYEFYIQRKPFLGDNYPVTDNVNAGGRLSLGPLRGRDPRLFRYVSGYAANAMPLPEASKPAFITIADYTWNPFAYDDDISWNKAMSVMGGDKGKDALMFFAKQSESSFIWKYDAIELFEDTRGILRGFQKLPDYSFDDYYKKCDALFSRYAGIETELKGVATPSTTPMIDEMQNWITKLEDYGVIGKETIVMLRTKYGGGDVPADKIDALEAKWNKAEENKAVMTKMVFFHFMQRALAVLRGQPEPKLEEFRSIMKEE